MRILHVTPHYAPEFHYGGVVRAVSILCDALAKLGHEVVVHTSAAIGAPDETASAVRVIRFPAALDGFLFSAGGVLASRRVREFDVVHLSAFWQLFGLPVSSACRWYGVPYVVSPHGSLAALVDPDLRRLRHRVFHAAFARGVLTHAASVHLTSALEREDAKALGLEGQHDIVPNPVPWAEFADLPGRGAARRALGLQSRQRVVLFLGRLERRKAVDVLLRGVAVARRQVPHLVLLVAGPDFGQEAALRALTHELGLGDSVRFMGLVDAAMRAKLLAAVDLLAVVARHGENFCLAAAEAMAAGVPVLVSNHTGVAADVARYEAGAVVAVSTTSVAEGLVRLLTSRRELTRRGENGRRLVRELYDPMVVAQKMVSMYKSILARVH